MKKESRKLRVRPLLCGLAVITGLALSGCSVPGIGEKKVQQKKIFVIGQSEGIQFWDDVEQGARDAAEEFGHEIHYSNAKSISDVEGQITLVNEAIAQKADAIVISLNDTEALKDPLEAAAAAGIKILTLNADFDRADTDRRSAFVGTNNYISGQIAGKHVVDAYKDPINDKALIVAHSASAASATARVGGFRSVVESTIGPLAGAARAQAAQAAAMAAAQAAQQGNPDDAENAGGQPADAQGQGGAREGAGGPPADAQSQQGDFSAIAAQVDCKGDVNAAKAQTLQMLQEHPEIKIVLATNESSTLGVCQAIQEMDFEPDDLEVIGFNANDAELQYLRAGILDGLVVQNPYNMGYLSVYYAGNLAGGQSMAAMIDTGVTFVTAENIDNDDIQLILDPKKYLSK
ncbi:MAG: substrate-binding domain-containing protein [Oscillospiraceae bacterium]|nr:substrate-binding domain-containing protein [Oscillospiraceae bacterium]